MAVRNNQDRNYETLKNISSQGKTAEGGHGAHFIADTDEHTASGGWGAITFIENTVFNAITVSDWSGDTITSETFPEGLTIYGNFTVIDLTSGACIAYFATNNNTVTTA